MSRYAKAIVAFFTTLSGAIAGVYADGNAEMPEVLIGLCTVIAASFGVYATPNNPPRGEPADPAMSETGPYERGASDLAIVIVACVFALVIVLILR